jgi:hypothetical protein
MRVTDFTRSALAVRRDHRDREREGWEYINENGGNLWELHRGGRWDHRIVDVRVSACGKALWIKTAKEARDGTE